MRVAFIIPSQKEFEPVREILKSTIKEIGARSTFWDEIPQQRAAITEYVIDELLKSDFIISDVTFETPNNYYRMGLAHGFGKPVILLINTKTKHIPFDLSFGQFPVLPYTATTDGLKQLQKSLKRLLIDFSKSPRSFHTLPLNIRNRNIRPAYIVDPEKLEPREFENLCFELVTQMGFKKVEWGKEIREIDLIAEYPKKDPDGYEYKEMWFISTGKNRPLELVLDIILKEPDYFFSRIMRNIETHEDLFNRESARIEVPLTLLLIFRDESSSNENSLRYLRRIERRLREQPYPITFRLRWWDSNYLSNLIQQYPQIAFKYFSEEARTKSRYRKSPEEMNNENIKLTENLLITNKMLEEEKKKRFIAERDAAWKDVAFKAAHKLGNPIDALDTFLQSLRRRLDKKDQNILQIANEMDICVEDAKKVIAQFKSLSKAQIINIREVEIIQVIKHSLKRAEENGVKVSIESDGSNSVVLVDVDRITECFDELVANSLQWLNKDKKEISVIISNSTKKELPEKLDKKNMYLKINFKDNGTGVPFENKEKIFAPFFTTQSHGTGLGLSLVQWIIENINGAISEKGKPDEGALFEIFLPLTKTKKRS